MTPPLRGPFVTLSLLFLVVAFLLSIPSVVAQNKGATSDAAKVCQQQGYTLAYTMVGGVPVGFANAGECVKAAARGEELGVSYLTGTLSPPLTVWFEGAGLLPGADVTLSFLLADHTTDEVGVFTRVSSDGTMSNIGHTADCSGSPNVVALTASTWTAIGTPISTTVELDGCS
jgi:hypothetical protein